MMNISEDRTQYMAAVMDTPYGAMCVKKAGKELHELFDDEYGHGIIVQPDIRQGEASCDAELYALVERRANGGKVAVRGHGWSHERRFIWTGSVNEFKRTWVGD
jgi:hypothetical protein